MSKDRIFVEWSNGCWVSSLDSDFCEVIKSNTAALGPPVVVEFLGDDEGWVSSSDEEED